MFNESEVIGLFFSRTIGVLESASLDFEIVCVNDGSSDDTLEKLKAASTGEPRIKIVDLTRNFGKEVALSAGIDYASGDAIVPIDADLQDPPELIPQMVDKWLEGFDMVLPRRAARQGDTQFKKTTAHMFYGLMERIGDVPVPADVGDFRLLDRRVAEAMKLMPERTRFMKGMFAWLGFRQTVILYDRPARAAGETKWRLLPLWNFAIEGIVSFTSFPLKIWSYAGFTCASAAFLYGIFVVIRTVLRGSDVPGYASLITLVLLMNGLVLIGLGVIGEYVARIFVEVKRRPLYLVQEEIGFQWSEETRTSRSAAGERRI